MAEPERPGGTATGWARLPLWQHRVLIFLSGVGLVAAIANAVVADTIGHFVVHAAVAVIGIVLVVTLISAYLRRSRK